MAVDIGPRIGIDGESEFRKQIQNVNQSIKTLQSEMKAVTAEFADNASAEQRLAAQNKTLTATIEEQERKLQLLKDGLQKSAQEYGENDTKTLKWKQAVNDATTALNNSKNALANNEAAMRDLGNETEEAARETSRLGDVFKGSLLSDIVMRGIDLLADGIRRIGSFMKDAVTDSAAFADEILTLSKTSSMSTDTLQELSYMSELVDVSVETVTGSMRRLSRNMLTAESGTGEAAEAFATLGVSISDTNGNLRDNEDVFADIIDALGKMDDETRRDATAMVLFGKSATDLNPLIAAGGDAIKDFAAEAHEMGYVLDKETLESLGSVQDGFDRFSAGMTTLKNEIGAALAPYIEELTDELIRFVRKVDWGKLVDNVIKFADGLADFVKIAAPAAAAIGALKIAQQARTWFRSFGTSLTAMLTNPAGLALTALGALATLLTSIKQSWQNSPLGKLSAEVKEAAEDYRQLKEDQQEYLDNGLAELSYTQQLKTELDGLVDANGRVKEGYEARAQFIANELAEATGVELNLVDGLIQGYDDLSASIAEALEQQSIETILASEKEVWEEAIVGAEDTCNRLVDIIKTTGQEIAAYFTANNQTLKMQIGAHLGILQDEATQTKALLDQQTADRNQYEADYQLALTDEESFLQQHGITMQAEWQTQIDNTAAILTDGAETMAKAAEGAVNTTASRMQSAVVTAGFDKAGEYAAQGFANGMGTYNAVRAVIKAATAIAIQAKTTLMDKLAEKSPSRVMMEIGEYATEGFAIGLTNGLGYVRKAMVQTVDTVQNGMVGAIPTPQPTMSSLVAGAVNGVASAAPAVGGGSLTVNLVMPDGKKLAQSTIKDFISVARANGTPIVDY